MIEVSEQEKQKLIFSVVHKYFENYPNKEDLFQVGYIGYMKAEENYNPNYGTKLSTYAYPYIYGEMKKFVREDKGMKVSRELQLLALKLEKISALMSQNLKRFPTISELEAYTGIPQEKIVEAKLSMTPIESIDEPINEEGRELTMHDMIPEEKKIDLDTLLMLRAELEKLSKEEKELIQYRYQKDFTQSETANKLGMSQVQVSRKESKVLTKLRSHMS